MANITALDNALREKHLLEIEEFLLSKGYEVLRVPLSAVSESVGYQLAIPELDNEQNEKTAVFRITVCKQKRDGTAYDPYEENNIYKQNVAKAEKKRKEREEKNKKKEKPKEEKE